jgi:hypothetical protein
MATIGNTYLSLADLYKRQDPNGQIAAIVELLAQSNPILEHSIAVECNDGTSHQTVTRSGIPAPTWRSLYQFVQPTKSTTVAVKDATGMLEAWSEIDSKLVEMSKDPAALRLSEAEPILEGINQDVATTYFYGDQATAPAKFTGLTPRYNSLSAASGQQIVDAGGTGSDNTSIWFVEHGVMATHLIYPAGTMAGIRREDKGKQTKNDAAGGIMDVHREKFNQDIGLSVRDWRRNGRIANIDVSDLSITAATGANLFDQLVRMYHRVTKHKTITQGKKVIYCNSTVMEFLDHQSRRANSNALLTWREITKDSEPVLYFRNMQLVQCDAILNTESRVV